MIKSRGLVHGVCGAWYTQFYYQEAAVSWFLILKYYIFLLLVRKLYL